MKKGIIIGAIVLCLVSLATYVVRELTKAHVYSGPGVRGNLIMIEQAKADWIAMNPAAKEMPTEADLLPYLTLNTQSVSFDQVVRSVYGEVYVLNKTGTPAYAYFPRATRGYQKGQTIQLSSNDLKKITPP